MFTFGGACELFTKPWLAHMIMLDLDLELLRARVSRNKDTTFASTAGQPGRVGVRAAKHALVCLYPASSRLFVSCNGADPPLILILYREFSLLLRGLMCF